MKGAIPRAVFKVSLFGLSIILLLTVFSLNTVAKEPSSDFAWSTNEIVITSEQIPNERFTHAARNSGGGYCREYTFVLKSPADTSGDLYEAGCATNTPYGIASGLWVQTGLAPIAGKLPKANYLFLPNTNSVIRERKINGKQELLIYSDFLNSVSPRFVDRTGELFYDLPGVFEILKKPGATTPLKGSLSNAKVSSNGKWLLLDGSHGYITRVNLETHESLFFGFASQSTKRKVINDITPDGSHALSVDPNAGFIRVYNLDSCGPVPRRHGGDCESEDLISRVRTALPHLVNITIESAKLINKDIVSIRITNKDPADLSAVSYYDIAVSIEGVKIANPSYVALGDSFASGEGDTDDSWYELGTNVEENKCHLSRRSYPYLLAEQLNLEEFHSVACSGAKFEEVRSGIQKNIEGEYPNNNLGAWYPGVKPQLEYLADGYSGLSTVTISIGGNDVGFADKLKECVLGPGTCKHAENSAYRSYVAMEITSLHDQLKNTYDEIIAQTEQNTKLYVVGYPQFVKASGGSCGLNVHLNDDERVFVNKATSYMNRVIKAAAIESGAYYLDIEDALSGANLCSLVADQEMAVNGLTMGDDTRLPRVLSLTGPALASLNLVGVGNESYHPNQNGHQLIQQKISELTAGDLVSFNVCNDGSLICSKDTRNVPVPDADYWGIEATEFARLYGENPHQALPDYPQRLDMITESLFDGTVRQVKVVLANLKPSSLVDFVLNSDPIDLGSYRVDQNGTLLATLQIPEDIETGMHTLSANTKNILSEEEVYYEPVIVYETSDLNEQCELVMSSGIDVDHDGIDDACDGYYEEYVESTSEETDDSQDRGDIEAAENPQDSVDESPAEITQTPLEQTETELELRSSFSGVALDLSVSSAQNTIPSLHSETTMIDSHQAISSHSQLVASTSAEVQDFEKTLGAFDVIASGEEALKDNRRSHAAWALSAVVGLVGFLVATYSVNKRLQ